MNLIVELATASTEASVLPAVGHGAWRRPSRERTRRPDRLVARACDGVRDYQSLEAVIAAQLVFVRTDVRRDRGRGVRGLIGHRSRDRVRTPSRASWMERRCTRA